MTVIVAQRLDDRTLQIVADRVWFGYGADRCVARKLFVLEDCVLGILGAHRPLDVVKARNFDELCHALQAQSSLEAVIVHDNELYLAKSHSDGAVKVSIFELTGSTFAAEGCYHNVVSFLMGEGASAVDAVSRVHLMWNLEEPVDVVSVSDGIVTASADLQLSSQLSTRESRIARRLNAELPSPL